MTSDYCGKKRDQAQACVAQEEEEEQSVLMAHAVVLNPESLPSMQAPPPPPPSQRIFVNEQKVFADLGPREEGDDHLWVLDTGATNHMTGCRSAFSELDSRVYGNVRFGDGSLVEIEGRGTIVFICKNGAHRALTGVYYIPRLKANIISIGQLDETGCRVNIFDGVLRIYDPSRCLLAKVIRNLARLYHLSLNIGRPVCLSARSTEMAWLWHARFGHLGFSTLRKMATQQMVRGLPPLDQVDQVCDGCLIGKQRRASFPPQAKYRVEHAIELVHGDLCGPIAPATPSGNKYFLLLGDDICRFMWLRMLSSKDQAPAVIKNFQAAVEVETGRKMKTLRTDRGGEFTSVEFGQHCTEHGVERHLTAPYSPQQNGVVERRNQSILSMARCMLKTKGLPGYFWGEAVSTAVFILNQAPTRALDGKTPHEAWHGERPAVHFLRTFDCIVHVKITRPNLKKLEDRSLKTIFVGYEPGSKAYRCYDPISRRVVVSRDVVFDEAAQWSWEEARQSSEDSEPFVVEYNT